MLSEGSHREGQSCRLLERSPFSGVGVRTFSPGYGLYKFRFTLQQPLLLNCSQNIFSASAVLRIRGPRPATRMGGQNTPVKHL